MNTVTPPPPSEDNLPDWSDRKRAEYEVRNWDNDAELRDAQARADIWKTRTYGAVMILFLGVFALLFLGSLVAWTAHYVLPDTWHWLTAEQLSKIQSVIFSGSLGGIVSLVAQNQFSK